MSSTSLIYKWRRAAQDEAPACGFAPVLVDGETISAVRAETDSTIAVEQSGGRITLGRRAAGLGHPGTGGAAPRIISPTGIRIWIATGHTDLRRGMKGLALIQEGLHPAKQIAELLPWNWKVSQKPSIEATA